MFKITSKQLIAQKSIVKNEIYAPEIAKKAKPGQFIILRTNETGERIPLTMANANPEKGTITIIYQVVGKTTYVLRSLKTGDTIMDVVGPLGKPTIITKKGTILCVGGGTGIAVLYPIAKALKNAENKIISIIGARNKENLIMQKEMKEISNKMHICTDDGSEGHHGFVSDILKKELSRKENQIKEVYCIGPVPMMEFCCKITKKFKIPTVVSLNAIMVDGTGMCGCCRVSINGKNKFTCVDGPEFDGHSVDFKELAQRLGSYSKEEQESFSLYKCSCNNL